MLTIEELNQLLALDAHQLRVWLLKNKSSLTEVELGVILKIMLLQMEIEIYKNQV